MNSVDEIANGAWTRLRNLIGALDRVDRLETSTEFDGWLKQLAKDDPEFEKTIQEFLLHGLRTACDQVNYQILLQLKNCGPTKVSDLLSTTRLSRVELVERINELSRAGLTVQPLDREQIEATNMATGLLALLNEVTAQVKALASDDHLLNPKAPMPNPKIQRPIAKP